LSPADASIGAVPRTTAEQQPDIARYVADVEPRIARTATLELDGPLSVSALTDCVERCLRSP
jgi:hypothetical protein